MTNPGCSAIIYERHHGAAMMREVAVETVRVFPRSMSERARCEAIASGVFFAIGRLRVSLLGSIVRRRVIVPIRFFGEVCRSRYNPRPEWSQDCVRLCESEPVCRRQIALQSASVKPVILMSGRETLGSVVKNRRGIFDVRGLRQTRVSQPAHRTGAAERSWRHH